MNNHVRRKLEKEFTIALAREDSYALSRCLDIGVRGYFNISHYRKLLSSGLEEIIRKTWSKMPDEIFREVDSKLMIKSCLKSTGATRKIIERWPNKLSVDFWDFAFKKVPSYICEGSDALKCVPECVIDNFICQPQEDEDEKVDIIRSLAYNALFRMNTKRAEAAQSFNAGNVRLKKFVELAVEFQRNELIRTSGIEEGSRKTKAL